jgi:hypothetical protein
MFVDVLGEAELAGHCVQGTFSPPADQVLIGHCIIIQHIYTEVWEDGKSSTLADTLAILMLKEHCHARAQRWCADCAMHPETIYSTAPPELHAVRLLGITKTPHINE